MTCRSGYYVWKNWDNWETSFNNGNLNTADKPIFKIEEVLLNEAEAKFELGVFDQGVADKTINKLRDRAGIRVICSFQDDVIVVGDAAVVIVIDADHILLVFCYHRSNRIAGGSPCAHYSF